MGLGFRIIQPPQTPNEGRADINYNFALLSGVTSINLTGLTSGASTFDITSGTSENGTLTLITSGGSTINIAIPTVSNRVLNGFETAYAIDNNFELTVSAGTYNINDTTYTAPETVLNLVSNDAEHDRLDVIVGDELSAVTIISGTAAQNPVAPVVSEDKVLISYINIPGQTSQQIFNGNRTVKRSGLPNINAGGETVMDWLENYFFPFIPSTLSINSHSLKEIGTTYSPNIDFILTLNDETTVTGRRVIDVTDSNTVVYNPATNNETFNAVNVTTDNTWKNEADVDNNGSPTTISSSNSTVSFIYPWFYGTVASGGAPSGSNRPGSDQALINSGTKSVSNSNGTLTVSYNSTSDDYIWFAIPSTSTSKTKWYVDALNNGSIGGAVNLFPDFDSVSIDSPTVLWNGVSYKIYVSNYQSSVSSIQLKNS